MAGDSIGGLSERIHALEDRGGSAGANNGQLSNAVAARRARARRNPPGVVPVPRRRRKTRGYRALEEKIAMLTKCMEQMLRTQPGVHVRQPSHINPPFWSKPIIIDGLPGPVAVGGGAGAVLLGTARFGGMAAVPDGYLGVVNMVHVATYFDAVAVPGAAMADPSTMASWTLLKNGVPVDGYTARRSEGWPAISLTATEFQYPTMPHFERFLPPIQLVPGDELTITGIRILNDVFSMYARLAGWIYPTRQDAPGIQGTIVD